MGDRANVVIKSSDNAADLVLYTHWDGYRVEPIVAAGIAHAEKVGRISDASYAQRIIVDVFLRAHADSFDAGTGAGVYVGEPYEPAVVVDLNAQTVQDRNGTTRSFAEFVAAFPSIPA